MSKSYKCVFCEHEPFFTKGAMVAHGKTEHKEEWEENEKAGVEVFEVVNDVKEENSKILEQSKPVEPVAEEILDDIKKEEYEKEKEDDEILRKLEEQHKKEEKLAEVKNKMKFFGKVKDKIKNSEEKTNPVKREQFDEKLLKQPIQEVSFKGLIADARHAKELQDVLTEFVVNSGMELTYFHWKTFNEGEKANVEKNYQKIDKSVDSVMY